tara:strand:+ start:2679 stop:3326 length:648 start_codon:yes stop_codon:yes gene_type:complete
LKNKFWRDHYKKFNLSEPSKFAQFFLTNYIKKNDTVVELGCGNGRDGLEICKLAKQYYGLDLSNEAISSFDNYINNISNSVNKNVTLKCADFSNIDFNEFAEKDLILYSRFSLHSINYIESDLLFSNIKKIKFDSWKMFIEVRTIFDPLYGQGENIGLHEYRTDHYRRFIDPKQFLDFLNNHFFIKYFELSKNFAPYGDQNPKVMRIIIEPNKNE